MTLFEHIKSVLSENEAFCKDGVLFKNSVVEAGLKLDPDLLKLLLKDDKAKKHFFSEVDGIAVFDKTKFQKFVSNKQFLPDSFTAFKNKIGLTANGEYLTEANEVVLDFPYKDCVLEGGQTKEDQKRQEIFWNETLAPDEIDRLFEPKVLTNWKRYDKDGERKVKMLDKTDNLIIKGNNLLALHSLLPIYKGKVKLIYIDPPYNTGSDSFGYNDRFNHSSWLTFMKNRLEIAKLLLSKNGVLFVHCDNNEQSSLKVLLDDIYKSNRFIETLTIVNNPRGRDYGGIDNMHEFIHIYAKDELNYEMFKLVDDKKEFPLKDKIGPFETRELRNRNTAFNDKNRPNLCYPFYVNPESKLDNGFLELSLTEKEGFIEVMPAKSQGIQTVWRWGKEKALGELNNNVVGKSMKEEGRYMIVEKYRDNTRLARSVWWDKDVNSEKGTVHLRQLFGSKVFSFPKPETLMTRILEIATRENDIVLDFHLGSGTTATTAHKMKRQYIGIEQMDYINTVTVPRLQKVIEGEKGGISEKVNWQGGGSFVYAELAKDNAAILESIQLAKDSDTLVSLWQELKDKPFISYKVNPQDIDSSIDAFNDLSLNDQKKLLISLLDKNQLYVNYNDIEDADHSISKEDKRLNHDFYKMR